MKLGELIQYERKEKRVSQEELASKLLRSQDWLSMVERGKIEPLQEDLMVLATELDSELITEIAFGRAIKKIKELL